MKFNHLNVPARWQNYWTRYPEGHTILEALISWVSQVDEMVDNQNTLNTTVETYGTRLDEFLGRFDSHLRGTVETTLIDWQTSGFLDFIINEALQWQLDDYIATNEQDKVSLAAQLQQTKQELHVQLAEAEAILSGIDKTFGDITYPTLGDLQAAYPTGDAKRYIVAADGKWYWWNGTAWIAGQVAQAIGIADKSQPLTILSVTKVGKNLFDKSRIVLDKSLSSTGVILSTPGSAINDYYIDVIPSNVYAATNTSSVCWYDVNKGFISRYITSVDTVLTAPENAAYARIAFLTADINTVQMEKDYFTEYEPFNYILPKENTERHILKNEDIPNGIIPFTKTDFITTGKNLLDPRTLTNGKYVSDTTGAIANNVRYDVSDYITISPHYQYAFSGAALVNVRIAFYNHSKVFIRGDNPITNPVTPPENAAYVRISFDTGQIPQFEQGVAPTSFEPYGLVLQNQIFKPDEILVFLPDEIVVAKNRTIELYNKQVAWCGNIDNFHFKWDCNVGNALKRKFSITGTTALIGEYPLTLTVYNNNMIEVASASTTLKVVDSVINAPKTLLTIGDSLTNNKPWLNELHTLSGNQYTLVGTRGTEPHKHEGRSGWSAGTYLSGARYTYENEGVNPFWDGTRFNWSHYKTQTSINPDAVQIYLGTNGLSLKPEVNANNIKQIVDFIRQDDATIPIFLVLTLYGGSQDGIGVQQSTDGYASSPGNWKLQEDRKVYNLMTKLFELLSTVSNLHFVPIALTHDSEYNFGAVSTPVNPRASQTELLPTEATHPQTQGYYQMADIMFSVMAKYLD